MKTVALPTEQDLSLIKSQIDDAKRKKGYKRLKCDLQHITCKVVNIPTEFDGVRQLPDTDKV